MKPFAARELLARVRAHLQAQRARREATRVVEAAKALAESDRARIQELLSRVPAMINFLRGPDLVWEFAHPGTLKRVGGRKLIGLPLLESMPEHRDQPFHAMLQKVFKTGEPAEGREVLFKLAHPETGALEDTFWNFMYLPVRNSAGQIDGVMTFDIDVTSQVVARRKAEALSDELKLADQRKDEFLAMLAHELRNPMAAISMALSVMERSPGDAAKLSRNRETARRQMGNLVRLVDDLLDVSRITRGRVELRKEPVDLAAIVQGAIAATRPDIDTRGHALTVTFVPAAYDVVADATRLEQVVVNLLTNAAKYTEPGGRITVQLSRDGADAVISVKDSGRGIPAQMLDKVFDVFVQVNPSIDRSTGGLGLGLTLVKRLVELHGGKVAVMSDGAGKGSEFVVRLPLSAQPSQAARGLAAAAVEEPIPAKRRILLVEDSRDVRESLTEFLQDMGHEVVTAVNGREGTEKLLSLRPDVALVDLGLPGIDGYEVARRVRAAPGGEGLYLIALTGYGGADAKAQAVQAGFDLHLTKPVDVDELPDVIARASRRAT